jgi:hypothetical protein
MRSARADRRRRTPGARGASRAGSVTRPVLSAAASGFRAKLSQRPQRPS